MLYKDTMRGIILSCLDHCYWGIYRNDFFDHEFAHRKRRVQRYPKIMVSNQIKEELPTFPSIFGVKKFHDSSRKFNGSYLQPYGTYNRHLSTDVGFSTQLDSHRKYSDYRNPR